MLAIGLGGEKSGDPLEQFAWKNRVILVFHSEKNAAVAAQQLAVLKKDGKEFDDRDLVSGTIADGSKGSIGGKLINTRDAAVLQQRFNPANEDFLVVLIGKDGGVKLKEHTSVSQAAIFDLIDSMPMRRSEMKKNQ
ncbi:MULTISPECIES: DUF4174 domain-containing protein [unclassified Imperialibacter]|uniref:DUF4174 domain-containing protein n=1 Tax=unclassified Imperialibacter TaxID=2629706 RepID=UPI001869A22F|nr:MULTISPECIES: DUF4174 domain-containing protein [unclassified Imperialibacter]